MSNYQAATDVIVTDGEDERSHNQPAPAPTAAPAQAGVSEQLVGMGIGLILIGGLQILWSDMLDPTWGYGLIAVGLLNLIFRHRFMFIINGLVICLAGLMNILGSPIGFWTVFGLMQLKWGVQEMGKYEPS